MSDIPIKLNWFDRAIQVAKFHIAQCKDDSTWTVRKTSIALNRSVGSISQDLLIASWSKTHEKKLKNFNSMNDALQYIRAHEREMRLGDL